MKKIEQIKTIAVIGAGTMGSAIAQLASQAGYKTILFDVLKDAADRGLATIRQNLQIAVEKKKIKGEERDQILSRIKVSDNFQDLVVDVVIEAVVERLEVKADLFQKLAKLIADNEAIFCSNTSSIPITLLAKGVPHPERIVGMHFFNPAHLMKLVEIVSGAETSHGNAKTIYVLAEKMGKQPVMTKDKPGFIVNRIGKLYHTEPLKILEEKTATVETIDQLLESCGFKMGPFKLIDLIGVDANLNVTKSLYELFDHEPKFRPSAIQQQLVDSGYSREKDWSWVLPVLNVLFSNKEFTVILNMQALREIMKSTPLFSLIIFILLFSCSFQTNDNDDDNAISYTVSLKEVASGLEAPVGLEAPNDGSGRLFVIEQQGTIRIIKSGQLAAQSFLDISSKIDHLSGMYSEKGLLGLAFHPQYKSNGKFYVYYSAPAISKGMDHKSIIAEYTVSSNPEVAVTSERILMEIDQPESNHNGGQLCFGPDGYLYIGTGDGGGAGDKHGTIGNGQNLNTLLGKILRIDVNSESGYKIPPDNPFINRDGLDEIFAYGLRNPWRFSFDRRSGKLFCADVGQNEYEEVNIVEKGKNYGWRIMEGTHCYNPSKNCITTGLAFPIDEYDHSLGKSVIGGYVYQGTASPDMQGKYIFGDWTGKIFMLLQPASANQWERRTMTIKGLSTDLYINSFGEGPDGTLYVLGQNSIGPKKAGMLYQLVFE